MRILVFEFATGGGMAGRAVPPSLAREGAAMLAALVGDLASIRGHHIVTTTDTRFPLVAPRGVEVATIASQADRKILDSLIEDAEAVWLIAPETDRCLERLASRVERKGKRLIGSTASAIRRAANKGSLSRRLRAHHVPYPPTHVLGSAATWSEARHAANSLGYPVVVKPALGAGCEGVWLAREDRDLREGVHAAREVAGRGPLLIQAYVTGVAASVSLLADGQRALPLTLNRQFVRGSQPFEYAGGTTPFDHRLAARAMDVARRACDAVSGLRGYVGVDVVLTRSEAVVIEINPRLTTAFLGLRRAVEGNVAALSISASEGALPKAPRVRRTVRFTAGGRIT